MLEKIPTIGTPSKADQQWLEGLGFGGGNNRMNLALLRQVGVIDGSGRPTEMWRALRAKDKTKFGAAVRRHYADLFAMYPDAHRKDDEALIAFVRSRTDYAEQTQRLAVRTFKVFTEFGEFGSDAGPDVIDEEGEDTTKRERVQRRRQPSREDAGVALTVNIQLQLPPSADGDVYDKLFAAMGKHLKGLVTIE